MSGLSSTEIVARYRTLLEQDPSDAMMKFWLAVTHLLLNEDAEAQRLLDLVFEVYPGNDAFLRVLTDIYTWRETPDKTVDYERAMDYIHRLQELKIAHLSPVEVKQSDMTNYDWLLRGVPLSFRRGEIHFLQGNMDKAIESYERSLTLEKDYYNAFYRLGLAHERLGHADKAVANFEKYISVTELNAYDSAALGREEGCGSTKACHSISRPAAIADAKRRIEALR